MPERNFNGARFLAVDSKGLDRWVDVVVTQSAGSDGAIVVFIDTLEFEPNASDGGPGLRVMVNDADVTECEAKDFVAWRSADADADQ